MMQLRRILGLSGEASGCLRRSHSTVASPSHPAWAMMVIEQQEPPGLRATSRLAEPPCASQLFVPFDVLCSSPHAGRGPSTHVKQVPPFVGIIDRATCNGLLLLRAVAEQAQLPAQAAATRNFPTCARLPDHMNVIRVVCNPLSGQLLRLPDISGTSKTSRDGAAGFLTQADRGHGPPDRYAVADVGTNDYVMHRFLSETGRWDAMPSFFSSLPFGRSTTIDHPPVAFGGRMWWIDLGWGAVSVDPFSDEPDFRIVKLPRGSVLPAEATGIEMRQKLTLSRYRRVGVSEGRLRYVEVSGSEAFSLSSFALDNLTGRWTLEYSLVLSPDGSYPGLPFEEKPCIGCIGPLNANVVYLRPAYGSKLVFGVDMEKGTVIGSSLLDKPAWLTPCVLPPWLGSCRIPSTEENLSGKGNMKNETLADILVRSDKKR